MYYTLTIGVSPSRETTPVTNTPINLETWTKPGEVSAQEISMVEKAFGAQLAGALNHLVKLNEAGANPPATPPHENPIPVHFVGKGRINVGATIFQDHHIFSWPCCNPPASEYRSETAVNPHMVFDVEWKNGRWLCTAPGYGALGNYGNGAIFLKNFDGVAIVEQSEQNDD